MSDADRVRERIRVQQNEIRRLRVDVAADLEWLAEMGEPMEASDLLDNMANPHPRLWSEAEAAFARRKRSFGQWLYWQGCLNMMCAATGYEPEYFLAKLGAPSDDDF